MKNLTNIFQLSLLAVLLCAAGLFISSVANAQQCELCQMAADGDLEGIQTRCERPGSANLTQSKDDKGRTALLHAARRDQTGVVKALLNGVEGCSPANPHSPNYNQRTPLMWAAQNGNIEMGMVLVTKMIALTDSQTARRQVNHLKDDGRTAADIALQYDQRDFLVELVVRGGGIFRFREHNPLTNSPVIDLLGRSPMAQTRTARDILTAILDSWNTNPPFGGYSSLAHWAFSPDSGSAGPAFYLPLARELLPFSEVQNIGYINASVAFQPLVTHRQRSLDEALTFAARTGNTTAVRILLQMGTDIEYLSDMPAIPPSGSRLYGNYGWPRPVVNGTFTPLMHAAYHGRTESVRLLLNKGADALYSSGFIPQHQYIREDGSGYTPLMAAARWGHVDIVELLLEHNSSNINQTEDNSSETALEIAVRYSRTLSHTDDLPAMASVFIRYGDIDVNDAIVLAAIHSEWWNDSLDRNRYLANFVQILLTHASADPNYYGRNGHMALHYAAADGNLDMVESLVAAGAYVDADGVNGDTPLHEAIYWNVAPITPVMISTLVRLGADVNTLDDYRFSSLHKINYASLRRRFASRNAPESFPESIAALLNHGADPSIGRGGGAFLHAMRETRSDVVNAYLNHYSFRNRRELVAEVLYRVVYDLFRLDAAVIREQESNLRLLVQAMADTTRVNFSCSSFDVPSDTGSDDVPFVTWAKGKLLTSSSPHVPALQNILQGCPGWDDSGVAGAAGAGGDRIVVQLISSTNDEEFYIPEEDEIRFFFNNIEVLER